MVHWDHIPYMLLGISPVRSDGNPAVKIEGRRGSAELSLHCKDREFPSNFDAVPNTVKCYKLFLKKILRLLMTRLEVVFCDMTFFI